MTKPADIDVGKLEAYLVGHVEGFQGPLQIERFSGGQSNPTYCITDKTSKKYVLRKKPAGHLLPSAHAIEREYRVMKALEQSEVPVPKTFCLCADTDVIGTPFFVMEHVTGRILWDPSLPGMTPEARRAIYDEMNRVVAALHRVDVQAAGLTDYGRTGGFFERQIARWSQQYQASATETIVAMDRLGPWLENNIPAHDETTLFHGDLRLDNLIFHPTEPKILAVLDWELSTLGHPFADFAYHALPWRLTADEFRGMSGIDYQSLGIPTEAEYLEQYCNRVGRPALDPHEWDFYLAYSMFRLASILQGILKRSLEGNASNANARETGEKARVVAQVAWGLVVERFPDIKA
jgi:aminoglycoside phosphotransferase (APT) family kinase protein